MIDLSSPWENALLNSNASLYVSTNGKAWESWLMNSLWKLVRLRTIGLYEQLVHSQTIGLWIAYESLCTCTWCLRQMWHECDTWQQFGLARPGQLRKHLNTMVACVEERASFSLFVSQKIVRHTQSNDLSMALDIDCGATVESTAKHIWTVVASCGLASSLEDYFKR